MRRHAVSILLVLGITLACGGSATACGDKFLVPCNVPKFDQAFASSHPGRILMYRNASSEVARAVMDDDLRETLERVGHVVTVIDTPEKLERQMSSGKFDVLLADVRDLEKMTEPQGATAPVMLPVVYQASWMEVIKLREAYHVVVNAPSRASQVVSIVDEAMTLHDGGD